MKLVRPVALVGFALGALALAVPARPAATGLGLVQPIVATTNHAAVIVDTGDEVKRVCLAFPEDQLTGAEVLRRAGLDAIFSNYGAKGEAVCSLCGVGCPSSNCFCDRSRFWSYHRAAPGDRGYTYSPVGASSAVVRDGDVEGWDWGTGTPPPFETVGAICGIPEPPPRRSSSVTTTTSEAGPPVSDVPPSPTTTAATGPATTAAARPVRGSEVVHVPAGATAPSTTTGPATAAAVAALPSEAAPSTTGLTLTTEPAGNLAAGRPTSESPSPAGGSGPSAPGVMAFVGVVAGLLGWRWRLARARRGVLSHPG